MFGLFWSIVLIFKGRLTAQHEEGSGAWVELLRLEGEALSNAAICGGDTGRWPVPGVVVSRERRKRVEIGVVEKMRIFLNPERWTAPLYTGQIQKCEVRFHVYPSMR
ncbi:hypothetical protein B0T21DRAFT_361731 [Apiosordaria backusii]|uniref:Uncharacterized protein n=1 Tax=Apiosordaria backusii TaxID=314023 RepID=A0AA40EHX5_9PEZI|nr:hypothetical protein B0T21DRAFT_361731 [Apiosordaria backusii]